MIKRILLIAILIITLFTQYSGYPAQGLTPTAAFVYDAEPILPVTSSIDGVQALPASDNSPVPSPQATTPSASPDIGAASPTPPFTPAPAPDPVGTPVPSPAPAPIPVPSPDTSPASVPTPAQEPAAPKDGIILNPNAVPGPLTDRLPPFDADSKEAAAFFKDMKAIIKKAEDRSNICSTYGVFIMDLKTGFYCGVNENLTRIDADDNVPEGYFNSASVVKLFQGYIFCDMIRNGELDAEKVWHDKVTGRKFKLMPMIKSMISYSDNNYSNACLRIVDNKTSNLVLNRLGIINSRLYGEMSGAIGYSRQNNLEKYGTEKRCARLTPQDTGLILYNIYMHKDTDPYMKALNEALLGNIYNTRIPVGVKRVSSKYRVAHKTGTNSNIGVYNDAGIVYAKHPFILVAFTQGTTSAAGHSFIRSLAEQLTRYFDKR